MPINFLNTVDLNKNLLNNARIQNLGSDPSAGDSSVGQIYYSTTAQALKIYKEILPATSPKTYEWVEVGSDSVEAGYGIGVTFTGGNVIVRNTGLVSVLDGTYINLTKQGGGDNTELTADLNAVDGTSVLGTRFLSKDNTWDVPAFDQYTHWTLDGDTGTPQNISSEDTASFLGDNVKISTAVSATDTLTISHDLTTRTDTTSAQTANAFPVVNSVITDTTGHVTAVDIKTVTVTNTVYSLDVPLNTTNINLKGANPASDDFITLSGYAGQTETNYISADEIQVALTDSVTIANSLTLTNGAFTQVAGGENNLNADLDMNSNKLLKVATGTDDTDGVNWGQVRDAIAGVGLFQGGYNAATGLTINLTTNGSLDGASNIALDKGDYFVVTTDGTAFYGVTLEVGDMIFANVDIAANSTPAQSVYTTVIQDANIAEADSTDANTRKGVAGFDSANFTASNTGWVQLREEVLSGRMAKVLLTGGTDLDGETTFTVDLTAGAVFGTGATAADAIATVKVASSNLIVFPKVTGNGTGSLDFKFIPVVADDVYTAIISIV